MKNRFVKHITAFVLSLFVFVLPAAVLAQGGGTPDFGTSYLGASDLPRGDLREVLINLINVLLGVLGIIFLILVLFGGFLWMTAGGNDEQAGKGRKFIINGVIGLIIIFLAFAIVTFVFNILEQAAT